MDIYAQNKKGVVTHVHISTYMEFALKIWRFNKCITEQCTHVQYYSSLHAAISPGVFNLKRKVNFPKRSSLCPPEFLKVTIAGPSSIHWRNDD